MRAALEAGIRALKLEVREGQVERDLAFLRLLDKWNQTYNLTAVRDPEQMLVRHVLDSLAVAPYLKGRRVADVGSGAGLPGVPLAIHKPNCDFVLIDAAAKKIRFLNQVVLELGLGNVDVFHGRVEDYPGRDPFDTVTSRAFAELRRYVELAGPLCDRDGQLLAMKGHVNPQELEGLPMAFHVAEIHRLSVPGLNAERHLIRLVRQ